MTEQERAAATEKAAQEKAALEKAESEKKAAVEQARAAEKTRCTEIRSIFQKVGLDSKDADKAIDADMPVDKAREQAIELLASRQKEVQNVVTPANTDRDKKRAEALENAILHRAEPGKNQLTADGREFRGMTLLECAREFLEAGGVQTRGLSKMDLAIRAFESNRAQHSTSDFPKVLENVLNKSLRKGYDEAPRTFLGWAKQVQVPDFKQVSRVQLGEAPVLEKVLENGEILRGTMGEGAEKYSLATYAKIIGISRQVVINDDLSAFTTIPQKFGFSAASLESDIVYAVLTANAVLVNDSVALFDAAHANLGTAGAPSVSTLAELRKLMRLQKGVDGARVLNIQAKYLIVPAALELLSEQLLSQLIVATQTSNSNPFINKLTPVVEPRLDAASPTAYYLAADPSQIDTVEYAYLEGQQGVYTETRMGFDVDGMEVKARLDFAAKAIDYRGLAKNVGA